MQGKAGIRYNKMSVRPFFKLNLSRSLHQLKLNPMLTSKDICLVKSRFAILGKQELRAQRTWTPGQWTGVTEPQVTKKKSKTCDHIPLYKKQYQSETNLEQVWIIPIRVTRRVSLLFLCNGTPQLKFRPG